ncbi:MAG: phosphoglycolate phosphatase [Proteobacteria bacterium]|nr:phosphoglycolate phosphatase [Pseudomonadota bacterium]
MSSLRIDLNKLDAAMVDLDGTMVDTLGDFAVALNLMLDELGLPRVAPAAVESMVGKGSEHLIHSVLRHVRAGHAADSRLYDAAWQSYSRHYLDINGRHSRVYAGVVEGLRALRARGLRLACLTNKPGDFAKPLLAAKGLDGYFDVVFGGDAFARKKPDPLPLVKTCEALGSRPECTLMIGDSSNDAQAARAAHCPVVLVSYGYNHGEPVLGVDADGVIDSLAQLAALRAA